MRFRVVTRESLLLSLAERFDFKTSSKMMSPLQYHHQGVSKEFQGEVSLVSAYWTGCRVSVLYFILLEDWQFLHLWSFLEVFLFPFNCSPVGEILPIPYYFALSLMLGSFVAFINLNFSISGFHLCFTIYSLLLLSLTFPPYSPIPTVWCSIFWFLGTQEF